MTKPARPRKGVICYYLVTWKRKGAIGDVFCRVEWNNKCVSGGFWAALH